VLAGSLLKRIGTLRVTSLATLVSAAIILVQAALHTSWAEISRLPAEVWWLSCINAVFCTVVPVFAVMMAIRRIGATRVAQVGMLGPVSTIAMGILVLGEPFTLWHVAGTALVLAGITLLNSGSGATAAPAPRASRSDVPAPS
jgi:drug/metabolite transporter (DMT)-like permease